MPQPNLHEVRENLGLSEKEAYRFVACAALDDITERSRPRYQWSHPHVSRLLGVPQPFTSMVAGYLDYRKHLHRIGNERGIQPWGASCAQTFLYDEHRTPMDLIQLGTSGDRTEQMAKLLVQATVRKLRVAPDTAKTIESMLGRACGMNWETITSTFQRQIAAYHASLTQTTVTTTAMGAKAA